MKHHCFDLLVISPCEFQSRLVMASLFYKLTFGATPTGLSMASMIADHFSKLKRHSTASYYRPLNASCDHSQPLIGREYRSQEEAERRRQILLSANQRQMILITAGGQEEAEKRTIGFLSIPINTLPGFFPSASSSLHPPLDLILLLQV